MRGRKTAVWTATNKCNLGCRFCFGREKREEFGTREAMGMILEMKRSGIRRLVFSGGEPLLRKDIWALAAYAKKAGLKTVLHTNGILVNRKNVGKIAKLFDVVNLPVDGANEKANAGMGRGSLRHTLEVIEMLSGKAGLTVSTVVTRMNLGEIKKIAELLRGKKIRKWRLFKFEPRLGAAKRNAGAFSITNGQFAGVKRAVRAANAEFVAPESGFNRTYWLVASDGTIDI
jgi:MoaA/NifB/PqqE/SkfB family radical SAM enzyme